MFFSLTNKDVYCQYSTISLSLLLLNASTVYGKENKEKTI